MKLAINPTEIKCCECYHLKNINNRGVFCYISLREDCPKKPTPLPSKRQALNLVKAIQAELMRRELHEHGK